ncbi:hypothetical protein SAMN04487916_106238 [Arthrobacter sp. ov407]|nr:hypothetical protein SAMN04487916_106238 [Arthrobacter sp. ov407]
MAASSQGFSDAARNSAGRARSSTARTLTGKAAILGLASLLQNDNNCESDGRWQAPGMCGETILIHFCESLDLSSRGSDD